MFVDERPRSLRSLHRQEQEVGEQKVDRDGPIADEIQVDKPLAKKMSSRSIFRHGVLELTETPILFFDAFAPSRVSHLQLFVSFQKPEIPAWSVDQHSVM